MCSPSLASAIALPRANHVDVLPRTCPQQFDTIPRDHRFNPGSFSSQDKIASPPTSCVAPRKEHALIHPSPHPHRAHNRTFQIPNTTHPSPASTHVSNKHDADPQHTSNVRRQSRHHHRSHPQRHCPGCRIDAGHHVPCNQSAEEEGAEERGDGDGDEM